MLEPSELIHSNSIMNRELIIQVFFGKPDGCDLNTDFYSGFYTWALYADGKFVCAGQTFDTWQQAFDAGKEFAQELPHRDMPPNDQN